MKKPSDLNSLIDMAKEIANDKNSSYELRVLGHIAKHLLRSERQSDKNIAALIEAVERLSGCEHKNDGN